MKEKMADVINERMQNRCHQMKKKEKCITFIEDLSSHPGAHQACQVQPAKGQIIMKGKYKNGKVHIHHHP